MSAPFEGFRAGARASTLPAQFFTEVLPEIEDADELRVTLYALYAITRPGRPMLAMRASEMAAEEPLARLFAQRGGASAVRRALDAARLGRCAVNAPFEGFRAGARASTLPAQFFTEVLPEIEDADELRVTLYALYAITRPGRPVLAMRASEMAAEEPLARLFAQRGGASAVRRALDAAVARGVLLGLRLDDPALEDGDLLCFVHNEGGQRLRDRVAAGALEVPGGAPGARVLVAEPAPRPSRPVAVYEQEIGLLTPAVASAIAEAEQQYPAEWIVEALREASARNARSWRYAQAILERWAVEGHDSGRDSGDDDEGTGRDSRGRAAANPYEHLIHRSYE